MRKLKYLLFLMIIFVSPVVFALDYDVTSQITSPVSPSGVGTYTGEENNGATYSYNIRTTYDGTLQAIRFNLPVPTNFVDGTCFSNNIEYKVTMFMADNDWRNRFGSVFVGYSSSSNENFSNGNVTFVSMRQIYFTFKIPSGNTYCHNSVYVNLRSSDLFIPFTGDTNWNLSSVVLTDPTSSSGGSSGSGSSNQDIIDNQTNNTNNIITNNNSNTTNIIDNNNQNSQNIMDNQNSNSKNEILNESNSNRINIVNQCSNAYSFSLSSGYSINGSNSLVSNENSFYTSDYVAIHNNIRYLTIRDSTENNVSGNFIIVYNSSKSVLDYWYAINRTITLPSGSSYFRISSTKPNINVYDGTSGCISKTESAINDLNDNITNSTNQQIESQKVCTTSVLDFYYSDFPNGHYLNSSGGLGNDSTSSITDYVQITPNTDYQITNTAGTMNVASYCLYNSSKEVISCDPYSYRLNVTFNSGNAVYFRTTLSPNSSQPTRLKGVLCKNGNQALTDSITDDSIDSGVGSDFFDDFTDQDFGLSQIITIPLTTIQSLTSKTCVSLQVPIPFTNSNVSLPCMTEIYQTKFPSIYNIWKIVSFGIISYLIAIDIFHIVKGFKDPESDKVEVLDL